MVSRPNVAMPPATSPTGRAVLMIVENLPVPFDRRVWLEAGALRDAGYRVTVICPKGQDARKGHETIDGIRIFRYPTFEARTGRGAFVMEFLWCWTATLALAWRAFLSGGFDVIHACNPPDTFFAIGRVFRLFGCRFIFDQHDLCPEMYVTKYPGRAGDRMHRALLFLERCTYRSADAVIVTNRSFREIAIERGRLDPERVFIVRNGPDRERIELRPADDGERHGAAHVLGYLGTMGTHDGVIGLLRVMRRIVIDHARADVHLVLVGGGPMLDALRAEASAMGIAPAVTFHGRVPNGERFKRIMSSMDLCVSPDPPSPMNELSTMNKTLEYMAFGRPVVAYALKETMYSGGDAVEYVSPGDEDAMAQSILGLLADRERRRRMAQSGLARAWGELSWEHSVPVLLAAYERAFWSTS